MARMHFPDEGAGGKCNKEFWSKWIPRRVKHNAFVMSLWACVWLLGTYPLGRPLSEGWRFMFLGMDHPKDVCLFLSANTNQRIKSCVRKCWGFIFFDCKKTRCIIISTIHQAQLLQNQRRFTVSFFARIGFSAAWMFITNFTHSLPWNEFLAQAAVVSSWGTMHMKPKKCKSPSSVPNIDDVIFFNLVFDFFCPCVLWDFLCGHRTLAAHGQCSTT